MLFSKAFLADKGYDQQFGARPLHRAIQKYLEDPLAEEILNLNVKTGDVLIADADIENSKLSFTFKSRTETEEKSSALRASRSPGAKEIVVFIESS